MAESSDVRQTEERLRNHLDNNQVMKERMCLALLPLLGPFTMERPRRPKGGPDGGRDIEAVHQGSMVVWGAVGFRNGGGADNAARKWATDKFKEDLNRALEENPDLSGFVFFTNVDLTPRQKEELKRHAYGRMLKLVEIYDMEVVRHTLDSAEGLIARLQYLDIPMSPTEQAALVAKFGSQLQNAVTARFDRVEQTLSRMERFLDLQKPIFRLDVYLQLSDSMTSAQVGEEAFCVIIHGLPRVDSSVTLLCRNVTDHLRSAEQLITCAHLWIADQPEKLLSFVPSQSPNLRCACAYAELSLTAGGRPVCLADATHLTFSACCTNQLRPLVKALAVDANGYELLSAAPDGADETERPVAPKDLPFESDAHQWVTLLTKRTRNPHFEPYKPSRRFSELRPVDKTSQERSCI